jgi:uncharacterized membrane protein
MKGARNMSKSTALKSAFQLLSLFLCLVCIPAACAQPDELTGSIAEDVTCESSTTPEMVTDCGNYTVHAINPTYNYVSVMPGDSETFSVSFRNEGNETINVAPKVIDVPGSFYALDKNWIAISPANVNVEPGMEQDFEVEVNVPEDAESGEYEAQIIFTDDVYSYEYADSEYIPENTDPQYVNVMHLGISVPVRPKLELQTSYISDNIEPGEEYVYEVKIKNVAGKDVTIDPEVTRNDCYGYPCSEPAFSDDVIEISAPSIIKAGEIAKMTIRVPVPENASGTYSGLIEMNADGEENDGSVPQINLDFTVSKQPSVPYVKTFTTTTADPITITVSADGYNSGSSVRVSPKMEETHLEVNLEFNSNPVNMKLVETTQSGYVYSQWYNFPVWSIEDDSNYESNGVNAETYKVSGAIGTWELTILPENANSFSYTITVGDSLKKLK